MSRPRSGHGMLTEPAAMKGVPALCAVAQHKYAIGLAG